MTDVAELVQEAAARAGAWPGEVPFLANLALLVESCERDARLNPTGKEVLRKVAVRHLRTLRDLQVHVGDHPEVVDRSLDGAVVITGLPRTGTTLLHNLLALDPAHRTLRFWEALRPVPPGDGGRTADALHAQAQRWLDAFHALVPEFQAIHGATAGGPEECDALLQNSFTSQHFDDMFDAPAYSAWLSGAGLEKEYEHYALQLRVLAGSPKPGVTWALKSPSHLGHLDAVLAALPGATIVVCHRHPYEAVASYASLVHTLRRAYSDDVSPIDVGRQALTRTAAAMRRAMELRDRSPDAPIVDVAYLDLVRDPAEAVRGVYRAMGRALAPGVVGAIGRWAAANPRHRHGPHRYDLARFGLSETEVDAAFAPYMERFGSLAGA